MLAISLLLLQNKIIHSTIYLHVNAGDGGCSKYTFKGVSHFLE